MGVTYVITVLICSFLITSDTENLSLCFLSLGFHVCDMSVHDFGPFFFGVGCIPLMNLQDILYTLHTHVLLILCIMRIFFPLTACLFILLKMYFFFISYSLYRFIHLFNSQIFLCHL